MITPGKELPQGWFSEDDIALYREMVSSIPNGGSMLELGTWKGRSICSVSDLLIEKNIKVFAVDTFKGTESEGDTHKEAKEIDLKELFENNLKDFGIFDRVRVVQSFTDDAFHLFEDEQFDLIFIDADHQASSVYKDITNYSPKLKKDGILGGHDWAWPSVRDGIWKAKGSPAPTALGNVWYFGKLKRNNKFSVCFIGKNESETLPRALESLKEFKARGGEICYLDTGSTDGTTQIARDFGCVVEEVGEMFISKITGEEAEAINTRFIVDGEEPVVKEGDKLFRFGDARNYCANKLASNDMISYFDCDEVVTKMDIDKIEDLIGQGYGQFEYNFVFAHDQFGNEAVKFVQSKFYNKKVLEWKGFIHEVLGPI